MRYFRSFLLLGAGALAGTLTLVRPPEAHGYVEAAHSLGQVVNLSTGGIVLMRVTAVDRKPQTRSVPFEDHRRHRPGAPFHFESRND